MQKREREICRERLAEERVREIESSSQEREGEREQFAGERG